MGHDVSDVPRLVPCLCFWGTSGHSVKRWSSLTSEGTKHGTAGWWPNASEVWGGTGSQSHGRWCRKSKVRWFGSSVLPSRLLMHSFHPLSWRAGLSGMGRGLQSPQLLILLPNTSLVHLPCRKMGILRELGLESPLRPSVHPSSVICLFSWEKVEIPWFIAMNLDVQVIGVIWLVRTAGGETPWGSATLFFPPRSVTTAGVHHLGVLV